jgi:hypothetical protein
MRGLSTVVAPTTLVTALLYYFGWARTSTQAQIMGLDESLFGFSARDYILRSITSMFWPLFDAALAILAGLFAHASLLAWTGVSDEHPTLVDPHRRRTIGLVATAVAGIGAILTALGAVGSQVDVPTRFISIASPLAITVGIVLIAYAVYLRQAVLGRRPPEDRSRELDAVAGLGWSVVTALVLLGSFWTVSHYAAIKGEDFAAAVEDRLHLRPLVTIYSETRLYLQPPVVETRLPDDESASYRYVYSGMRLLFRSDGRLFLRPSDTRSSRNIVITEGPTIRVEYE